MTITAKTRASFFSFGEIITMRFMGLDTGEVNVQISSEPILPHTKIDYGKNCRNVAAISKALKSITASATAFGSTPMS
jgi:hypothetical protein